MVRGSNVIGVVVGGVCAIAACASPGDFPDFGEPLVVASTDDSSAITLSLAPDGMPELTYSLVFAGSGIKMPDSLSFEGMDVMAPKSADCSASSGVGVGILPDFSAVPPDLGGPTDPNSTGDSTITMSGPAVGQVLVTWSAGYTCGAPQVMRGTSRFTAFPNGRIVRHDATVVATETSIMAGPNCQCAGTGTAPALEFATFWNLAPGTGDIDAKDAAAADGNIQGCTPYQDAIVGVSFEADTTTHPAPGAYQFDFKPPNSSTIDASPEDTVSAIQLAPAGVSCATTLLPLDPVQLMIGDSTAQTNEDGIYQDDSPHPDAFDIAPVDTAIPAGFAVILDLDPHAAITRDPPSDGEFFVAQVVEGGGLLLYFRDGLDVGNTIHVEPK